ncbi:hypothetical protein AMTR_s00043p00205720 [Amborella trichopoda]|uniref:Uncharacterized protein n=1 Tax=Amborella trichopoda TaxID=13333 RepID=W1PXZ9_AMBTC|nr:hypothetical protein AMTR_s00043p00205720 [Amborella trichopoda]
MSQEKEVLARFPDEERSTQLKDLEANYALVKGKLFRWNSHLVSFSTALVSEPMALMSAIDALSIEYGEKHDKLDEWRQKYLANLVALRGLEGCMEEIRTLIEH